MSRTIVDTLPQVLKDAIEKYDGTRDEGGAQDFLAQFRSEQVKNESRMSQRDLINHLMNNLQVPLLGEFLHLISDWHTGSPEAIPRLSL